MGRDVFTQRSFHLLHMSCSVTRDKAINLSGHNPQTNKNTAINKYNNSNQQAAKYNLHHPALKGNCGGLQVLDVTL